MIVLICTILLATILLPISILISAADVVIALAFTAVCGLAIAVSTVAMVVLNLVKAVTKPIADEINWFYCCYLMAKDPNDREFAIRQFPVLSKVTCA